MIATPRISGSGSVASARNCTSSARAMSSRLLGHDDLVGRDGTDLSPLPIFKDHPDWLLYWLIVNGFISEFIRRARHRSGPDASLCPRCRAR